MQLVSPAKFIEAVRTFSKSNHRYKSLIISSSNLQELSRVKESFRELNALKEIDGFKVLFSPLAFDLVDVNEAKFWFQPQLTANSSVITFVTRIDWILGRWAGYELANWFDFVAKLETIGVVILCTSLSKISDRWEQMAVIENTSISVWKPLGSGFNLFI